MSSAFNGVIVKPDADFDTASGFTIPDVSQLDWSITGTVMEAPKHLVFLGKQVKRLMKWKSARNKAMVNIMGQKSLQYGSKMELKKGDRVCYMFSVKYETRNAPSGIVIPYDMIYARIDPDGLYPLNGYILIRLKEKKEEEMLGRFTSVKVDDKNEYGCGEIAYIGRNISGYRDYDHPPTEGFSKGDVVYFEKGFAHRMEMDVHNSLNKGRQSSLFCLHRKDVLWKD